MVSTRVLYIICKYSKMVKPTVLLCDTKTFEKCDFIEKMLYNMLQGEWYLTFTFTYCSVY